MFVIPDTIVSMVDFLLFTCSKWFAYIFSLSLCMYVCVRACKSRLVSKSNHVYLLFCGQTGVHRDAILLAAVESCEGGHSALPALRCTFLSPPHWSGGPYLSAWYVGSFSSMPA